MSPQARKRAEVLLVVIALVVFFLLGAVTTRTAYGCEMVCDTLTEVELRGALAQVLGAPSGRHGARRLHAVRCESDSDGLLSLVDRRGRLFCFWSYRHTTDGRTSVVENTCGF